MSSSMVYGDFNADKVNEDKNCKPIGIYGTLKFSGELLVSHTIKCLIFHIQ